MSSLREQQAAKREDARTILGRRRQLEKICMHREICMRHSQTGLHIHIPTCRLAARRAGKENGASRLNIIKKKKSLPINNVIDLRKCISSDSRLVTRAILCQINLHNNIRGHFRPLNYGTLLSQRKKKRKRRRIRPEMRISSLTGLHLTFRHRRPVAEASFRVPMQSRRALFAPQFAAVAFVVIAAVCGIAVVLAAGAARSRGANRFLRGHGDGRPRGRFSVKGNFWVNNESNKEQ